MTILKKEKKYANLFETAFSFNLMTLKLFGMYPFDSYPGFYKYYSWTLYWLFTVTVPVLGMVKIVYDKETDVIIIGEMLFLTFELFLLIFKTYPFKAHIDRIKEVLHILNNELFQECAEGHERLIEIAISHCRWTQRLYLCLHITCLFLLSAYPFMTRNLPVDILVPYDWNLTDLRYYSTFFLVFWCIANAAVDNAGVDTMVMGTIYQAATQLRVLKETLQNLMEDIENQMYQDNVSEEKQAKIGAELMYKRISRCVDHHNTILEYTRGIQEIFSAPVLTQFLTSIVVICLSLLRFSYLEVGSVDFICTVLYCATICLGVFVFCFYGTLLFEESQTLPHAIYMGKWYEYEIHCQKLLLTLMERAKKPILLTAGSVMDLNIPTFSMLMRRTYSTLAVLWNFTKD